jgi:hypothetical protein
MEREGQPRCEIYRAGHQMHWIQWKLTNREGTRRVGGRLVDVRDDGWFVVELVTGEVARWWDHDPDRIRALLLAKGDSVVTVVPDLHALVIQNGWVNYSAHLDSVCHPVGRSS